RPREMRTRGGSAVGLVKEVGSMKRIVFWCSLVAGGWLAQRDAAAQVLCSALPNPIYLQIGDTQEPLIKNLGKKLRDSTVSGVPMTIVYKTSGSCTNIDAMYNSTPFAGGASVSFIPSTTNPSDPGYVAGWTPMMASPSCLIDAG